MDAKTRKGMMLVTVCIFVLFVASAAFAIGVYEDRKISGERMYAIVKDLCDIAGTGINSGRRMNEAGEKAATYIFKKFKDIGLQNVRLEPVETTRWWPRDWEVTVLGSSGEETILSFPWWYSYGTESVEAELVYVGYGTPGEFASVDVKDKIVLVEMKRFLHFIPSIKYTGAYETAIKKGARAVILTDALIDAPSGQCIGSLENFAPIPVFSIGKSTGEYLKGLLKSGPVKVRVRLNIEVSPWTVYNVVGELPGNGKIDEIILVGGHYDSWFTGAVDNAGGVAGIIELARYYAKERPKESRDRDMMFVALFGHEFGDVGHKAFIKEHQDILGKITTFLDADGWGSKGYEEVDGEIRETGYDEKRGIFTSNPFLLSYARETVVKYNLLPTLYWKGAFVADQPPFYAAGIPQFLLIGKNPYYHSLLDTPEKISPDILKRTAEAYRDIIDRIDDTPEGFIISTDVNPSRVAPNEPPSEAYFVVLPSTTVVGSPVFVYFGFTYDDHVMMSYNCTWDFGDGGTAVGPIAYHVYMEPGVYTITMTIADIHGATTTASKQVVVR